MKNTAFAFLSMFLTAIVCTEEAERTGGHSGLQVLFRVISERIFQSKNLITKQVGDRHEALAVKNKILSIPSGLIQNFTKKKK